MALPRAFVPLRHAAFRTLWLATLASNSGMWLQSTAAGWMMTSLDSRPLMVSLVQAAGLLPVFLLALPAGALADIVDRRRFLIAAQLWMFAVALLLTALTAAGALGPWGLLTLTFLLGAGTAMNFPAWAATTPELVPREDLVGAIALNGIGFNLARAVGPALGGFAIAAAGPEAAFGLNALAFLVLIVALVAWKREAPPRIMPRENLGAAMRAGIRFTLATPAMHAAIIRACTFFFFTAAIWGLLPLLVRQQLGLGAEAFGLMLGAMGIGAVAAGFLLPALRGRMSRGALVFRASLVASVAMALCATATHWTVAAIALALYGAGWIAAGSTTSVAAQLAAPPWVRARGIAIFQLTFFGAMAAGSTIAGWLGNLIGVAPTMAGAAASGAAAALLVRRFGLEGVAPGSKAQVPLPRPEAASPALRAQLHGGGRRVHEVVRYWIEPADRGKFLAAMAQARRVRQRSGAVAWQLLEDVAHPDRWIELWAVENWADHLREADRLTEDDRAVLALAAGMHKGATPPEAARYLDVPP